MSDSINGFMIYDSNLMQSSLLKQWHWWAQDTDQAVQAFLCTRLEKVGAVELELFQNIHPLLEQRNKQRKRFAALLHNINLARRQQS